MKGGKRCEVMRETGERGWGMVGRDVGGRRREGLG